jgi:hypothetical protein
VRDLDNKLVAVKNWDDWYKAALYAWNAAKGVKNGDKAHD